MKILTSLAIVALAGSLSAQTNVLTEDFSAGVGSNGWTIVNNNGSTGGIGWEDDLLLGRAWHQDEFATPSSDNTMVSPVMDFTGLTGMTLTFGSETKWSQWLANHPLSNGDGVSTMEVSTDGGATWAVVWTDVSQVDNVVTTETVDLSAYDGMSNVQLGVHFFGTFAQEWWVDNISVDDGGTVGGLVYSITNLVAGQSATFAVSGATPGGGVVIGYSLTGPGPVSTPYGVADMSPPIQSMTTMTADGAGDASFSPRVPGGAAGMTLYTQCLDLGSSTLTNSLAELVL